MEIVYNGYDNEVSFRVHAYQGGTRIPVGFGAITSMRLEIPSIPQTVILGPGSWDSNGVVTISNLGAAGLPEGEYTCRLVAIDAGHPNGQVLVHEDSGELRLRVT